MTRLADFLVGWFIRYLERHQPPELSPEERQSIEEQVRVSTDWIRERRPSE